MNSDLKAMYDQGMAAIASLDENLDSVQDAESAGKRKVTNDLVDAQKDTWGPFVENAIEQLKEMDTEALVGVYNGILRALRAEFDATSTEYVTTRVEAQPKTEKPDVSEEQLKEWQAQRSTLYAQIKQIVELAKGMLDEDWEMPAPRRGSRGKRGKRALSFYNWFIDGTAVTDDSNTPAGVAKLLGFDKAAEFTKVLKEAEIDTRKPPAEFEVEAKGHSVKAVRDASAPTESEEEEEGDEEEEE